MNDLWKVKIRGSCNTCCCLLHRTPTHAMPRSHRCTQQGRSYVIVQAKKVEREPYLMGRRLFDYHEMRINILSLAKKPSPSPPNSCLKGVHLCEGMERKPLRILIGPFPTFSMSPLTQPPNNQLGINGLRNDINSTHSVAHFGVKTRRKCLCRSSPTN